MIIASPIRSATLTGAEDVVAAGFTILEELSDRPTGAAAELS